MRALQRAAWRLQHAGLAALLALLLCPARTGAAICEYGSLPGMMVKSATGPFTLMWRLFDPRCQLKDELTRVLGPAPWTFQLSQDTHHPYAFWAAGAKTLMLPNPAPQVASEWQPPPAWAKPGEKLRILYFGDSVDAAQVLDVCREAQRHGVGALTGGFGRNCPACQLANGVHMVQQFIPGVWPTGPYLDHYTDLDAPQHNIPKGFQNLQAASGDMRPHIISFNALLWDLGRLQVQNAAQHSQPILRPDFVHTYRTLLDNWLRVIENAVPNTTLLVFHNAAYARLADCKSTAYAHTPLGHLNHITQLNAAARLVVAERPRWHLIDYGQMSEAFMHDHAHLRDGLHPNSPFVAQGFNILLNLYREHRLALEGGGG